MMQLWTKAGTRVLAEARDDTTDPNSLLACIREDEYGLSDHPWSGVAFDIGAHVGGVTLALLADNPDLRVVAVEALPENREVVRQSLALNGWENRAVVPNGAAACGTDPVTVAYGLTDTEFAMHHRFIGGLTALGEQVTQDPISLSSLVAEHGAPSLVKIDCEGCEWSFLDDPAVASVAEFRGEYHPTEGHTPADLRRLLEPTHVVTLDDAVLFGPFSAVRRV